LKNSTKPFNLWEKSSLMIIELKKTFRFEAAHRLPNVPEGHPCQRLHGHSFHATIELKGEVDERMGWLRDFGEVKEVAGSVISSLDHYYLNEIEGLENPTAENLSKWIWDRVKPKLPELSAVEIAETCTTSCRYQG
jgi:6-pyruvoyltetrahydropterin/6-carboxytetrahydropterin synthase